MTSATGKQHRRFEGNRQVKYAEIGDSLLLKAIGNTLKLRLMDIFLTNPYFKDLEQLGVVVASRRIG